MKIERLIGILSVLLQKGKATAPELAEKFEVSRRTITRDIAALCRAGIPLVTTQGQNGGIAIMEGYAIDRTLLTAPELEAILAGLGSLDSVSGTRRYARLMDKLAPGAQAAGGRILIDLSSWYRSTLAPKIEMLDGAIARTQAVAFTYHAPRGESARVVEPYALVFQWSSWYVWGYCRTRREFRLFKLNRMTGLVNTGESFAPREAPPPDLRSERVFPPAYEVCARFAPRHKWRLVEEYGPGCFAEQPDGTLLFRFPVSDGEGTISWLLSFGEGAELLEPAALRAKIARVGAAIARAHQDHAQEESP